MTHFARYLRLLGAFARFGLLNEMAFRTNFIVKVTVELLWMGLLMTFYTTVFHFNSDPSNPMTIEGWTKEKFLIFLGCYWALEGVIETFFLENCNEFSDLVRKGDLDVILLKPIDEQFLVTCRKIDWSTAPNVLVGSSVIAVGLVQLPNWHFDFGWLMLFLGLFVCGVAMAYSFLVILMATAVWLIRNQSLMELWWLFTTLMRYPREIYKGPIGEPMQKIFSFFIPILLVVYVPAQSILQVANPTFLAVMFGATIALLWLSRLFFRRALKSYRSASS